MEARRTHVHGSLPACSASYGELEPYSVNSRPNQFVTALVSARGGIARSAAVFGVIAILGVAVISGLYLASVAGPTSQPGVDTPSSAPGLSTSTSSTTTTVRSAYSFGVQAMNSSIIVPSSGQALADFYVNSTVSGTFYFEAIPNGTPILTPIIPGEANPPFPIPSETLPDGLSASYPDGQVLGGTTQGTLAVEMAAAASTPSGDYTLYLCVDQQSGEASEASAFQFTVDVTSG